MTRSPWWPRLLAFATIYLVWGSTFLAIRVGVQEVPPFTLAAIRFSAAGAALCLWMAARGEPLPNRREWWSAFILATPIFVIDAGLLFWAERRVSSGVAAVFAATIPAFMALAEITILRTQRLTPRLAVAIFVGFGGVSVLLNRSLHLGGMPVDRAGGIALIIGPASW